MCLQNGIRFVVAAVLGCCFASSPCFAEDDVTYQVSASSLHSLNAKIEALEAKLASYDVGEGVLQKNALDSSCSKCGTRCYCEPCAGWFADAELLLLYWHDTDDDDGSNAVNSASRFNIGYTSEAGRSLTIRYLEFAALNKRGPGSLQLEHVDLEYAGRFSLGHNWRGEIGVGGRWASLRTPQVDIYEDTIGPMLGVTLHSDIYEWMSLYARGRQSYQFGREVTGNMPHDTFAISELALGLEYTYSGAAGEAFLRTGFESQYYQSVRDDEEDYGLVGYTLAVGFRR